MFAFQLRKEIPIRIILIAAILFNALISVPVSAQEVSPTTSPTLSPTETSTETPTPSVTVTPTETPTADASISPTPAVSETPTLTPPAEPTVSTASTPAANVQQVDFAQLPLSFVANVGQLDKKVKFQTNILGGSIFFTASDVTLALMDTKGNARLTDPDSSKSKDNSKVAQIEYKNTGKNPIVEGLNLLPGVANYVAGTDKKAWFANAPTYDGIIYRNLYPGIDLTYEGSGNSLKSTFFAVAGADPSVIQWNYKYVKQVGVDAAGNLLITLPAQNQDQTDTTLIEHTPLAWQEKNGQRNNVAVSYVVAKNGTVSFTFPQGYDSSLPLVIDPTLTYSTYLGGVGTDVGYSLTTDSAGNVYVTGYSYCTAFPILNPLQAAPAGGEDVIISKINASGNALLYSTCIGGSGNDEGLSIALDSQDRIIVGGITNSTNFPIVGGIATYGGTGGICSVASPCQDNFIVALNAGGTAIRYSTYLGGNGREDLGGIGVDANNQILVTGSTTSANFPTVNAYDNTYATGGTCSSSAPCYDVTVTKINPGLTGAGSIAYSTYLGGTTLDKGTAMTLDASGKVYLTGYSNSDDYPIRNAAQIHRAGDDDVILTVVDTSLSGNASLIYSSYFGSSSTDAGYAIALDASGNVYLTGRTISGEFPLRDPLQYAPGSPASCSSSCYDAFVTKFNIATNSPIYSTYLGGNLSEYGYGIAVDSYGRAYITGFTRSTNFPVVNPIQASKAADGCSAPPCMDAFISVLEPDGQSLAYSTYLGGNQDDIGNSIRVDANNQVYIAGETFSTNFPTTAGAYDLSNTETTKRDVFISKISALPTAPATPTTLHLDARVMSSSDDAEESGSGVIFLANADGDLDLIRDVDNQTVGIRFDKLNLPRSAVILNAQIQFTVDDASAEATTLNFQAEASDNASTFTTATNNISSRLRTSASVPWSPVAWNIVDESGPNQRTPNLASVIQEVINRPGWNSGNALAVIITGTGKRDVDSYDDNVYDAPYLHITYTMPVSPLFGATLTIQPDTAGPNVTGNTHTLTATLNNSLGNALSGVNIQFVVTGANSTSNSTTTNANGSASFTYPGLNFGTDSIQAVASIGTTQLTSNTALMSWITPVQQVSTSTLRGRFFPGSNGGVFNIPSSQTPAFEQMFPTVNFNPPEGTVPGNTSGVGVYSRPFTNVITDLNGNYTGTIAAEGNGYQAGVGPMFDFSAVFTGELIVASPGDISFNFFSDDGFIFSVGNGATRVSGPMVNPPASGLSAFENLTVVGSYNQPTGPVGTSFTVHFPTSGSYPYELNYTECCAGELAFTMTTAASGNHGVPPVGAVLISPASASGIPTGQQQALTLHVTDASGIAKANLPIEIVVSGPNAQHQNVTTDASGQAIFTYTGIYPGTDTIQAVARVSNIPIYSANASVSWILGTPPVSSAPLVIPGWIGSPAQRANVSGVVPITLASNITLQSGTIDYWPTDDPDQITILGTVANISGGGTLASLDTTTLPNGSYIIRLQGTNSSGVQQDSGIMITVSGEYKPGRVRFTITDFTIPVAGLPIAIGRTYDGLERNEVGDFGNGWSLAIGNPKLEKDFAHNVTLTMPDGKRSTFYFTPIQYPQQFGFFMKSHYTPEAGVYGTLEAPDCLVVLSGGKYFCFLEDGEYSPAQYTYTDPYGRKYVMLADGTLQSITDLNKNILTFSPTGITSSAGNINVPFVRDAQGRITKITYPVGKDYVYHYDANSDLDTVTFPTVTQPTQQTIVLKYSYYSGHFFKDATDPRNIKPVITTYDASNRIQSVTDAAGNQTTYDYDLTLRKTTIHYLGDPAISTDNLGDAVLIYDAAGYLTDYTDPLGNLTKYFYNSNHNLIKVRDPLAHEVQYTYNADGHPTSIIDPLNKTLGNVDYNKYGGPTAMNTAQGGSATVTYDPVTFMPMSASDSLGSLGSYTWTPQGNPQTFTNQYGETTGYTYTPQGYVDTVTDPLLHKTHYAYDEFGRVTDMITAFTPPNNVPALPESSTTHYKYDELGRMIETTIAFGTNKAATTKYEYDANGNRTLVTDSLNRRTKYQYDNANRLILITYAEHAAIGEQSQTKFVYDIYSRLIDTITAFGTADESDTHYEYYNNGLKKNVIFAYGSATTNPSTTHYEYYPDGRVKDVVIAYNTVDEATTHYVYDAAGRMTDVTIAYGQPEASTTHYTYYDSGLTKTVTTAYNVPSLAATTTYFYDSRGRSTVTQYADGTSTSQSYDLTPATAGWVNSTTDQGGVTSKSVYDAAGRLTQTLVSAFDPTLNGTVQHVSGSYAYDAANRMTDSYDALNNRTSFTYYPTGQMATNKAWKDATTGFTTTYDYNLAGEQTSVLDANSHQTQYQYNERGMLKQTTYAGGVTTSQTYDFAGRLVTATDENGIVTKSTFNPAGQLTAVTMAFGTADATTINYAYNFAGQLASMTDAKSHVTSFLYDDAGRQTKKTLPDLTYEQYGYNAAGNMTSKRLADGNTNTFTYDVINRLTQIAYFDNTFANFTYLANGQRDTSSTRTTLLATPQVTDYDYDAFGRLKQVMVPDGRAVSYTYNNNDQRLSMTTPLGTGTSTVNYGYNGLGQLASVTSGSATTMFEYDPVGFMTKKTLPNGVKTVYAPNVRNQLTNVTTSNSANAVLQSFDYQLDNAGNRKQVTEAGGATIIWGYDNLYRLTSEARGSTTTQFHYDAAGNRDWVKVNGVTTTTYSYNALDQLTSAGSITYNYNGRGDMTKITNGSNITNYTYNAADQLTNVSATGVNAAYVYNADGKRVKQTLGSTVTNYLWDEGSSYGDVVYEYSNTGSALANYVLAGNQLISQTRGSTTKYFLQDGQGSTRGLLSNVANPTINDITDTYSYTAFGELFSSTGTTTNPYRYTGQQFDTSTGLYSLRARYYTPALGRFLSQDTYPVNFGNPVELNRYDYTANNPVNAMDPTGQSLIEYVVLGAGTGGVVGGLGALACGQNVAEGILLGIGFGALSGAGLWYAYQPVLALGTALSLGNAAYWTYDGIVNGWHTCHTFNVVTGLVFAGLGGRALYNDVNIGGLRFKGPPIKVAMPEIADKKIYRLSFVRMLKDLVMTLKIGRPGPLRYGNIFFQELGESTIINGEAKYNGNPADGRFIWVQELDGTIRFALDPARDQGVFRTIHPMLARGLGVLSAGEMEFHAGRLISINNGSGHYAPDLAEVFGVRDILVNVFGLAGPAEVQSFKP